MDDDAVFAKLGYEPCWGIRKVEQEDYHHPIVRAYGEAVWRMDRKRKKRTSNQDWVNPHDPDAGITKMKDGATHLPYKAEQAVDVDTGASVAITVQGGATGDTDSVAGRLCAAGVSVAAQIATRRPTANIW